MSGQIKCTDDRREKMQKDACVAELIKTSSDCSSFSPWCRAVHLHGHRLRCDSSWAYQGSPSFLPCCSSASPLPGPAPRSPASHYSVLLHQPKAVPRKVWCLHLTVFHTLVLHIKQEWLNQLVTCNDAYLS